MKKYIIIISVIVVIGIAFTAIKKVNNVTSNQDFSQNYLDSEDSLVIKKDMLKNIEIKKIVKSNLRNSIKFYRYKKIFNLYITKIDIKKDVNMEDVLQFNEAITSPNSFVVYTNLQSNKDYNIKFLGEKIDPASSIIFSMAGNGDKLKKIVYNKNFISYCLPLYTFSLQYDSKSNPIDAFVGAKESKIITKEGVPFIISFYKKGKSIYLFLMTPVSESTKLDPNILSEFIN